MNDLIKKSIEQCAQSSLAGDVTFGEVVSTLIKANVESYHADYRTRDITYYMIDGATHIVKMSESKVDIPQTFDMSALQAAIRGAQRDEVRYPGFMKLSMEAGCVSYIVWLIGRHVIYFGHRGETHVEQFPSSD